MGSSSKWVLVTKLPLREQQSEGFDPAALRMEEEVRWEGAPWFYGVQMVACLVVVYGRSLVLPKVPVVEKLASSVAARSPLAFPAFQRVFLGVFYLASGAQDLTSVCLFYALVFS